MHVHIQHDDGEAKFWIEPEIVLANNYGLSDKQIFELTKIIQEKIDEIKDGWEKHFKY